jgi:hypothetical protein
MIGYSSYEWDYSPIIALSGGACAAFRHDVAIMNRITRREG